LLGSKDNLGYVKMMVNGWKEMLFSDWELTNSQEHLVWTVWKLTQSDSFLDMMENYTNLDKDNRKAVDYLSRCYDEFIKSKREK